MTEYKYQKIKKRKNYDSLLASGLFWELFPELSGDYEKDMKNLIQRNK